MNYCSNCGNALQEEKYCPNCGAEVGNNMVIEQDARTAQYRGNSLREQAIAQMEDMMSYFGAKQELYNEFDAIRDEVTRLELKSSTGWLVSGIIWGIIVILIGANKYTSPTITYWVLFSIPTILLIRMYIKQKKKNAKKLTEAIEKRDEIGTELALYHGAYENCPLGIEYTYPSVLYAIYEIIRSGRKETIADALQTLIDDEHARRLEEEMRKTRELAEDAAEQARQANKHAQKAEKNAKNAEIWSRF